MSEPSIVYTQQYSEAKFVIRSRKNRISPDRIDVIDKPLSCSRSSSFQKFPMDQSPIDDIVIAVFVVTFDTKSGNMLEWKRPDSFNMSGIEFKSLISGAHLIQNDFVYFRYEDYYGLACYAQMSVDDETCRGVRMKSVGILTKSYVALHRHMSFLERQVRRQLSHPGCYDQLEAFYEDNELTLMSTSQSSLSSSTSSILPHMKITHPAGCFEQFINFFGEKIFTLWKYALLQKRILFFSPPPIGVVCYRVYCCCALSDHCIYQFSQWKNKPLFYVNLNDIEELSKQKAFIACTTEKVFEIKSDLYDVYVDNQNVIYKDQSMNQLRVVSDADRIKLEQLKNSRYSQMFSEGPDGEDSADEVFLSFFRDYNTRLFDILLDTAQSSERYITAEHVIQMGLDPRLDRTFLTDLIRLYGIDVILMIENPCCPP